MHETQPIQPLPPTHDLTDRINTALGRSCEFRDGCPNVLSDAIRYSLLAPGKRLRPRMVVFASIACGGDVEAALPPACAIEMVHAYSLIHDDLPAMDDDELRRGRPTCHKVFGEANAILAGDALLARAFELLATEISSAEIAVRCVAVLADAAGASALVGGQVDDLAGAARANGMEQLESPQTALSALRSIHSRKTGAMFRAALHLGGIVGGGDASALACLDAYGRFVGLAFQITDDLLDVGGEEEAVGKRLRKDEGLGKMTYPGLLGLKESREHATRLIDDAKNAITSLGSNAQSLVNLADSILIRTH